MHNDFNFHCQMTDPCVFHFHDRDKWLDYHYYCYWNFGVFENLVVLEGVFNIKRFLVLYTLSSSLEFETSISAPASARQTTALNLNGSHIWQIYWMEFFKFVIDMENWLLVTGLLKTQDDGKQIKNQLKTANSVAMLRELISIVWWQFWMDYSNCLSMNGETIKLL